MGISFNKVILAGGVTRDPELRYAGANGQAVCDIGLAVSNFRKGADGKSIEETCYVDCTLWGKTAEFAAEKIGKGTQILVEGKLKMDSWQGKDGEKRSKLKVTVDLLQLAGSPRESSGGEEGGQRTRPPQRSEPATPRRSQPAESLPSDDIPF